MTAQPRGQPARELAEGLAFDRRQRRRAFGRRRRERHDVFGGGRGGRRLLPEHGRFGSGLGLWLGLLFDWRLGLRRRGLAHRRGRAWRRNTWRRNTWRFGRAGAHQLVDLRDIAADAEAAI